MLKARIITALILLPIVLGCLFSGSGILWGGFSLFALSVGAWEWGRFASLDRRESFVFVGGFVLMGAAWLLLPQAFVLGWALLLDIFSLIFWFFAVPIWLSRRSELKPKWFAALTGLLVLLAALAAVTRLNGMRQGSVILLLTLAIAWIADISAYFCGRAFGKRKLAPSISPGKSWEGVYGAVVAVAIYAVVLNLVGAPLYSKLPLFAVIPLFILLTGVSVIGDLFESLLKRLAGMKDSSNLLPGHGGVLDRVDSLLALAPVAASLLFFYARLSA